MAKSIFNWNNNNNQNPWGDENPPDLDEIVSNLTKKINEFFGFKNNGSKGGKGGENGGFKPLLSFLLLALLGVWAAMGVNILDEKEKGVVLRLGQFHETIRPGFNWNPYIIDSVFRERVTEERQYTVSGLMLTKDENIVQVPLTVQFNIGSIKNYILYVNNPLSSLYQATDSAIRHAVGSTILDDVLGEGRVLLADEVKVRLQRYLDNYGTGITIVAVTIQEAEPPSAVKDAFDDVIAAKEDKDRYRNEAEAYRNGVLPEARGAAQRIIEEANAYKGELIAKAKGESERFLKLLAEYSKAPNVTRERLYIDAVQHVMQNSTKVLVDIEGGNNIMYLPLDKLVSNNSSSASTIQTDSLKKEIANDVIERLRTEIANSNQKKRGFR